MLLDYPRDGAARCGDIMIYSALTFPPLRAAQAAGAPGLPSRRRCTVWRHNDLFRAHVPASPPETVPRVERGTPPPAGAVASLDSSSSSLLGLVVVVLLLDLDFVNLRLLLHA